MSTGFYTRGTVNVRDEKLVIGGQITTSLASVASGDLDGATQVALYLASSTADNATLTFEGTTDGSAWTSLSIVNWATGILTGGISLTSGSTFLGVASVGGLYAVRVNAGSVLTVGTIQVTFRTVTGTGMQTYTQVLGTPNVLVSNATLTTKIRDAANQNITQTTTDPAASDLGLVVRPVKAAVSSASGVASSSGNNTLLTPGSGNKLRIFYLAYNPASDAECAFRFGAAGSLFLRNNLVAKSVVAKDFGDVRYIQGATDESLILNLSSAVSTVWNVFYVETT